MFSRDDVRVVRTSHTTAPGFFALDPAAVMMKFLASVLCLASSALALPASAGTDITLVQRQTVNQVTDQYLYSITLPAFTLRRNARDPPTLIWDSDGCSSSPDNPFGFPFTPACHRHDFGYRNYKNQNRFTDAGKLKIDNNFKTESAGLNGAFQSCD
jgi:hypothetical protein